MKSLPPGFLPQFTLQLGHRSDTGAHKKLQQADRHTSTRLIQLGAEELASQSPTAAHKIRSVKLFLPTAVAWAKQHIQTMAGHAFLEVNTGQGPFPIQPWLCIICFLEVKVYLWGPEKDSWLVEM